MAWTKERKPKIEVEFGVVVVVTGVDRRTGAAAKVLEVEAGGGGGQHRVVVDVVVAVVESEVHAEAGVVRREEIKVESQVVLVPSGGPRVLEILLLESAHLLEEGADWKMSHCKIKRIG